MIWPGAPFPHLRVEYIVLGGGVRHKVGLAVQYKSRGGHRLLDGPRSRWSLTLPSAASLLVVVDAIACCSPRAVVGTR